MPGSSFIGIEKIAAMLKNASGSLGLAFATAHHYAAPYLDPQIEKAKSTLAPVFNTLSTVKDAVIETAAEFVPERFKSKPEAKPEEPKQP